MIFFQKFVSKFSAKMTLLAPQNINFRFGRGYSVTSQGERQLECEWLEYSSTIVKYGGKTRLHEGFFERFKLV